MEFLLLSKLLGAGMAICKVRCDQLAFTLANFLANVKDQQGRNVLAVQFLFKGAHRKPPNSLRSLRVARNKEFFTVSSVVPSASPMARSFRP